MPLNEQKSKHVVALVAALRKQGRALSPQASETAKLLTNYAAEIENPESTYAALTRFAEFAMHYKGLRDIAVPELPDSEWVSFVEEVRVLSRTAMREKGLDKSLLGRIHSLFRAQRS